MRREHVPSRNGGRAKRIRASHASRGVTCDRMSAKNARCNDSDETQQLSKKFISIVTTALASRCEKQLHIGMQLKCPTWDGAAYIL